MLLNSLPFRLANSLRDRAHPSSIQTTVGQVSGNGGLTENSGRSEGSLFPDRLLGVSVRSRRRRVCSPPPPLVPYATRRRASRVFLGGPRAPKPGPEVGPGGRLLATTGLRQPPSPPRLPGVFATFRLDFWVFWGVTGGRNQGQKLAPGRSFFHA